jgi:hypothetical protein
VVAVAAVAAAPPSSVSLEKENQQQVEQSHLLAVSLPEKEIPAVKSWTQEEV